MKKLTVLLFAMALGFSLVACGTNANDNAQNDNSMESVEGTEETTDEVVDDEFADDEFADEDLGDDEFVMPTISAELQPIKDAVANALGENYWPNALFSLEQYEGWGFTPDLVEDFFIEGPMMSAQVDTLMVFKPAEGKKEDLLNVAKSYLEHLQNDSLQYPTNLCRTAAAEVVEAGDYICFVMLGGNVPAEEEATEEERVAYCKDVNAAAIKAIEEVVNQ